jgi:hypothetical protein
MPIPGEPGSPLIALKYKKTIPANGSAVVKLP